MSEQQTILIVDDDADLLEQSRMVLDAAGYNVATAVDSIDAADRIADVNPDLVLVDIVMEEVDAGLVFAEKYGTKYPMIVLSSIAESSDKVFDVQKLPVKGVLQKPVPPAELLNRVKGVLGA